MRISTSRVKTGRTCAISRRETPERLEKPFAQQDEGRRESRVLAHPQPRVRNE
jgi:hypothetical protein